MSLNKPVWKLRDWIDISKLNWSQLSKNPNAIDLLIKYPKRINWKNLSLNPNAIELLEKNQDKINWCNISKNPSIFQLDYKAMKIANEGMYE